MKLKTEQEVESLGYKIQGHPVTNRAFTQGYMQAQQDLLSQASEGFENYLGTRPLWVQETHTQHLLTWKAATLSQAKENEALKKENEELKIENEKLKSILSEAVKILEEGCLVYDQHIPSGSSSFRSDAQWFIDTTKAVLKEVGDV